MSNILSWIIANWGVVAAGILIILRFIESGLIAKKWDIVSLLKEFCTLR